MARRMFRIQGLGEGTRKYIRCVRDGCFSSTLSTTTDTSMRHFLSSLHRIHIFAHPEQSEIQRVRFLCKHILICGLPAPRGVEDKEVRDWLHPEASADVIWKLQTRAFLWKVKEACRQDLGRYVHLHSLRAIRLPRFSLLLIPDQTYSLSKKSAFKLTTNPCTSTGNPSCLWGCKPCLQ